MRRAEITVTGNVHGVFFRQGAKEQADMLGITGWAKNNTDGSVTLVAEGEKEALKKFVLWCKIGTKQSLVEGVTITWDEAGEELNGFEIR